MFLWLRRYVWAEGCQLIIEEGGLGEKGERETKRGGETGEGRGEKGEER
jgi:hypothetical protein